MTVELLSSIADATKDGRVQRTPRHAGGALQPGSAAVSDPEQLRQAVRDIQRVVESMASELNFSIDQESGKTVVRVVDSATQKLIRQIPSEDVLAMSRALNRLAGFLVQEQA